MQITSESGSNADRKRTQRWYLKHRTCVLAQQLEYRKRRSADPVKAERAREWRREHKRKLRRAAGCPVKLPVDVFDQQQTHLARVNAGQAWQYWVRTLAPSIWLDAYWAAHTHPWRDTRMSDAKAYALQYRTDAVFSARERQRSSARRFLNPKLAAMWERTGNRWSRAAWSADGSITKELLKALSEETHCAYCLQPMDGDIHLDHVWPLKHGGSHSADNLVAACGTCNRRKSSRMPLAWLLGHR